jgi:hypothetical protein
MKPYFYVYRETTLDGRPPTRRHATLELAQAEAERLAVEHTGSLIQILKCVGISQVTGPASTFFMDGEGPHMEEVKDQLNKMVERRDRSGF